MEPSRDPTGSPSRRWIEIVRHLQLVGVETVDGLDLCGEGGSFKLCQSIIPESIGAAWIGTPGSHFPPK